MFVVPTKTLLMEALQQVFGSNYPNADFRSIWISMEYPIDQSNYPGIWVDFRVTQPLSIAGIDHTEYTQAGPSGAVRKGTRWRFVGDMTMTFVAMTSLERDRLLDSVIGLLAFGLENQSTSEFRRTIESNDLVALQMQWDTFEIGGQAENPGTPWGTDDIIYEASLTWACQGEFISSGTDSVMVPLSSVTLYERRDDEPDTTSPSDSGTSLVVDPNNTVWH